MYQVGKQLANQVLVVALAKALVCVAKIAVDGHHQWMAVLTFLGVQVCFAEEALEAVAQVVVTAL